MLARRDEFPKKYLPFVEDAVVILPLGAMLAAPKMENLWLLSIEEAVDVPAFLEPQREDPFLPVVDLGISSRAVSIDLVLSVGWKTTEVGAFELPAAAPVLLDALFVCSIVPTGRYSEALTAEIVLVSSWASG